MTFQQPIITHTIMRRWDLKGSMDSGIHQLMVRYTIFGSGRKPIKSIDMIKSEIIGPGGYKPEDIRYDDKGVWTGETFHASDNPRLEYARLLGKFIASDR